MLALILLAFQILPPGDPVRAAELQERAMITRVREHEREARERANVHKRQFELKFNQLVDAVKNFSEHYNAGKGHAWPAAEAAKLRKAMRDLQRLDDSLRAERCKTKSPG